VAGFLYGTLLGIGKWNNVKVFLHMNKNLISMEHWRIRKLHCEVMQYISNTHGNLLSLYIVIFKYPSKAKLVSIEFKNSASLHFKESFVLYSKIIAVQSGRSKKKPFHFSAGKEHKSKYSTIFVRLYVQ
jgi:hypothetical protein